MQYTVEVAIAYSCDYNEAGLQVMRAHGREYVEAMHKEFFRDIFRDVEGLQLHSLCLDIVSPDDLFDKGVC